MRLSNVIPLVLLIATAGGCARPVVVPPRVPLPPDEVERVLASLRAQALSVARYRSVVRLHGKGPRGRFRATLVVAFERPDRLRVELLAGPFSSSQWMAVATGGEMTVFFPSRREYLREPKVASVVAALLGVELDAQAVMAVLSGAGLPPEGFSPLKGGFSVGQVSFVDVGAGELRVSQGQVESARSEIYRVTYPTKWRSAPDRIELRTADVEAFLAVSDLDLNVPLEKEVFELLIPEDARLIDLARLKDESVVTKVKP